MKTTTQLISDREVKRVHGNANFGATSPRLVLNVAAVNAFRGYHNGSTARAILLEHKLFYGVRDGKRSYDAHIAGPGPLKVTAKGRKYVAAVLREADHTDLMKAIGSA